MPVGTSTSLSITNPLVLYRALIATNKIRPDPAQHRLALQLQKLYFRLKDYDPELEYRHRIDQIARSIAETAEQQNGPEQRRLRESRLAALWRRSFDANVLALTRTVPMQESAMNIESPQGMLLYGEVGRGKSMLLDLLYDSLPSRRKRRWHFNTFILDVFRRLEAGRIARMKSPNWRSSEHDHSVLALAKETIVTSPILFLDEFQLPDRTSSKLLNGFMASFFHLGGVLVASSNRMPEELAKAAGVEFAGPKAGMAGLFGWTRKSEGQRAAQSDFGQFLEILKARCEIWEMEGERDWRRDHDVPGEESVEAETSQTLERMEATSSFESQPAVSLSPTSVTSTTSISSDTPRHYHISFEPSSPDFDLASSSWSQAVRALNPSQIWHPTAVHVYGRTIKIPQSSRNPPGVAKFSFPALCASNLGPADYITIASTFHTLILSEVPVLTLLQKNEARRFITLLDALYESKCRLLLQAAAPPDSLFFPETRRHGSNSTATTTINPAQTPSPDRDGSDSVYQETFSEIYQDSLQPFRPNISSYTSSNLSSSIPQPSEEIILTPRSVLADEDADFGPTYGNGRGHGQSSGDAGLAEILRRQEEGAASTLGPDFTNTTRLTGEDERFAYKRARSRLWEMCGKRWWDERHGSRAVEEWWRPVQREERHWEGNQKEETDRKRSFVTEEDIMTTLRPGVVRGKVGGSHDGSARLCAATAASGDGEGTEDEGLFRHGASPFRTSSDPPPKLTERHVWRLGLWGPKAGRWGRGETKEDRNGRHSSGAGREEEHEAEQEKAVKEESGKS